MSSDVRAAAEVLSLAYARAGKPPARAPSRSAPPPRAAPAARVRDFPVEEGRPFWMERMGIPITGLPDSLLDRLDRLGPGYTGWGREDGGRDGGYGAFFVDVAGERYTGPSLHRAISAALAGGRTP